MSSIESEEIKNLPDTVEEDGAFNKGQVNIYIVNLMIKYFSKDGYDKISKKIYDMALKINKVMYRSNRFLSSKYVNAL